MNILMFVCTTVLYKYMKLLGNDVHNLSDNTHVSRVLKQHCLYSQWRTSYWNGR